MAIKKDRRVERTLGEESFRLGLLTSSVPPNTNISGQKWRMYDKTWEENYIVSDNKNRKYKEVCDFLSVQRLALTEIWLIKCKTQLLTSCKMMSSPYQINELPAWNENG